ERHRAEWLLQRPGALEAERLGARHVRAKSNRIELTVRNELRNGDGKSHMSRSCLRASASPIDVKHHLTAAGELRTRLRSSGWKIRARKSAPTRCATPHDPRSLRAPFMR